MSGETWHEERDRLELILNGIKSGVISHIDEEDLRQLQALNPRNIGLLEKRLVELNARLGSETAESDPVKNDLKPI